MLTDKKTFYLQLLILVAIGGFFFYYFKTKPANSFNEVYNNANDRLDSIRMEVKHSQDLINQTIKKLDAIKDSVAQLQKQKGQSNTVVKESEETLKKQLQVKEKELTSIKLKYQKTFQEKESYRSQLDSLAETIGN